MSMVISEKESASSMIESYKLKVCSIIYNTHNMEATQMPDNNEWLKKLTYTQ